MSFFGNLKDALFKPKLADPVRGTAQVVSSSMPPYQSKGGGMCEMHLVITIPGQPSVAVRTANLVRLSQWPMSGTMLPVLAERNDPRRFVILWDEVSSGAARAAERAEQIADRINAGHQPVPADGKLPGGPVGTFTTVTVNGQPATDETLAAIEAMTGLHLNGLLGAAGQAGTGPAAGTVESRLAHLQSLRQAGLVSDEEYRAKRAGILASL